MVIKAVFGAARQHFAVDQQVQLRGKTVLPVGAVKIRGQRVIFRQGDGVGHGADGVGKAAEDVQIQIQSVFFHNALVVDGHGDHLGQGIADGNHKVARLPPGDFAEAHHIVVAGLADGGRTAVDGDPRGLGRQGEDQIGIRLIQMQIHLQGHHGIAVNIDGAGKVHPGGGAFRRGGQGKTQQGHAAQHKGHGKEPEKSLQRRYLHP